MSSGRCDAASLLRERISGLCLARLERVGEAKDGRWGDRKDGESSCCSACCCDGGPEGVVELPVGEVLRLFAAEDSIVER